MTSKTKTSQKQIARMNNFDDSSIIKKSRSDERMSKLLQTRAFYISVECERQLIANNNVRYRFIIKNESIIQQTKYLENDVINRAASSNANDVENENENIKFRNESAATETEILSAFRDNDSKHFSFRSFTIL